MSAGDVVRSYAAPDASTPVICLGDGPIFS